MLRALFCAFVLLPCGVARALPSAVPMPDADADAGVPVAPHAEYLVDPAGGLSLQDVRARVDFAPIRQTAANFGYTDRAHWLRFVLPERAAGAAAHLMLEIRFPALDHLELHVPYRASGGVAWRVQRGGDRLPWDTREIKSRGHTFRIETAQLAGEPVYLRLQTHSVLTVPAYLWLPDAFAARERSAQLGYGMFYGLVGALFLYNLMLLATLRDRVYLWYVLYVGTFGLGLAILDGTAFQYLWPRNVWWANHALGTMLWATALFGVQFARGFLDTPRHAPRADRFMLGVMALAVAGILVSVAGSAAVYASAMRALSIVGIAVAGATLYVAIRAMLNGYRPARFFLLAWSALLVFIALGALRNFGLVPTGFWTLNGLHLGLALDVLLLSCALADRVNLLKHEAELARAEVRERERSMEQLRHMAQHDALTGLPNRASMQQRLELAVEIARRSGRKLAVMVADLDGFKQVNDRRGHAAGDHVLVALAGRLRAAVRGADTVARLGGDEFVVLAGDLDRPGDAGRIAEKVCDAVRAPLPFEGEPLQVGCSLGISLYPDDAATPAALLELADRAMYAAKAQVERRYAFFAAAKA